MLASYVYQPIGFVCQYRGTRSNSILDVEGLNAGAMGESWSLGTVSEDQEESTLVVLFRTVQDRGHCAQHSPRPFR
jgi:hypothetical protein